MLAGVNRIDSPRVTVCDEFSPSIRADDHEPRCWPDNCFESGAGLVSVVLGFWFLSMLTVDFLVDAVEEWK